MTINNEQIQALKAAAESATTGEWAIQFGDEIYASDGVNHEQIAMLFSDNSARDAEFIAAANPAAILSLLAERDADKKRIAELKVTEAHSQRGWNEAHDQESRAEARELQISEINDALCKLLPGVQYMDPPDGGSVTPLEQVARMVADYRQQIAEQAKRIAELEARTLTVKLPQRATADKYVDGNFDNSDLAAIYNTCRLECEVKIKNACAAAGITLDVGE